MDLLNNAIADLEAQLGLKPNQDVKALLSSVSISGCGRGNVGGGNKTKKPKKQKQANNNSNKPAKGVAVASNLDQPEICKLEFKVGVITKVWVHKTADTLYCEEIDVGEESGPRQIASGLRKHFSLEQMLGQRLLVVSNLKARNLVGFKSHGMVLCCSNDDGKVEFVEPPTDTPVGEVVTFDGLPAPEPLVPNQVDKRKVFQNVLGKMTTNDDRVAVYEASHAFQTTTGPCTVQSIANGVLK